jgi:hypothetical protein
MSYVRAQLGALFPDFVDTPSDQPAVENQETSAAAWDNGGEAGRSLVNNVPSVRSEIDELRDEIERLRGVVGGLASDLSGGVPVPVTSNEIATSSTPPVDAGDEDDRAAVEGLLGNEEARKQDTPAESELGLPRQVSSNELCAQGDQTDDQHEHILADILGSLTLIFPRSVTDKSDSHQLFSIDHLSHLRESLHKHLAS